MAWSRRTPSDSESKEAPVDSNDGRGRQDADEESQLLPDLNVGLVRGEAREKEKFIGAINTGLVFSTVADGNADLMQSPINSAVHAALTQDFHDATPLADHCSSGRIGPNQCCDSKENSVGADGVTYDQHGPNVTGEQHGGFTGDMSPEDPFGLSPIIRQITKEAKLKTKRAHAGRSISRAHSNMQNTSRAHSNTQDHHESRIIGTLNNNGKRCANLTDSTANKGRRGDACLLSLLLHR
ncbi:unnamed protein product [Prunus armeniaca]|uniref:Uncharacterized protein n=1 Tax=Prunus armeniaca TaxID=36596 RepID=A0A6J5WIS5_PRUAR|nr:unnamed protein product [Prunus armeniaca]